MAHDIVPPVHQLADFPNISENLGLSTTRAENAEGVTMKQVRTGLLVAMALLAVPAVSAAQAKGAKPKPAATAGAKPGAAGQDAKAPKAGAADQGAIEIDADQPADGAAATTPPTDQAQPAQPEGGLGDICQIDPDACPKINMEEASKRDLKRQIYAVQQIYALRARRVELQPFWATTMNDQFVTHTAVGLGLNYYMTNVLAIGANFNWYGGLNSASDFNGYTRRAVRVGVPLTEYQMSYALNFTYVPMYGKFSGFGDFIFHWDAYVVGGVGAIATRPIVVFDPKYRSFDYSHKLTFNAGLGVRVFFNRWFAAILELRDYMYQEQLESTEDVDKRDEGWRQDSSHWNGDKPFTNNVQIQAGVSVFLPFSWEYRLPK
jgi:outer membrane beta-barrel protein